MPNLIMPPSSFKTLERETISGIVSMHRELLEEISNVAEVCIIGRNGKDDEFWEENVFNDDKEIIDPFDGLPIINVDALSHFCVVSIKPWNNQEIYFGNKSLNLSEFVRKVLERVQNISEAIDSKRNEMI